MMDPTGRDPFDVHRGTLHAASDVHREIPAFIRIIMDFSPAQSPH